MYELTNVEKCRKTGGLLKEFAQLRLEQRLRQIERGKRLSSKFHRINVINSFVEDEIPSQTKHLLRNIKQVKE